ncbi:hypothetical protein N7449_000338 [Penicillium cf. viridicatum]|uniref:Uncharacterized protein n=1 Tax=Penicillium cf. viridicatum TaxID=2972119 RepID=A0A9W9T8F7_9EURO|nr:hypothetical protein N7449_000338 [Penicillium cf. viridicatum]
MRTLTKTKHGSGNWTKSKRRSGRDTSIRSEVAAAGVAVGAARNASPLPDEIWESGTAPLGADAA